MAALSAVGVSRFAGVPRAFAGALLAALLALCAYGSSIPAPPPSTPVKGPITSDAALYRAIAARVAAGEGYYRAAAAEQRAHQYPLKPFVTMRLPTLAWASAALGPALTPVALRLLALAAFAALLWRLRHRAGSSPAGVAAALLAAAALTPLTQAAFAPWHEIWAGCLVLLALACRGDRRWGASVVLGLLAVLVRELAMPLLVAMAIAATIERRRGEALAWSGAILLAGAAILFHARAVAAVVLPGDLSSPGWASAGGWGFDLRVAHATSLFGILPYRSVAVLVPLAVLGWAGLRGGLGPRVLLTLGGWLGAFMIIGRPDNFYWGLLFAPLLPIGLAFAPAALRDLIAALAQPRPCSEDRAPA